MFKDLDETKYIFVEAGTYDDDDFKPPTSWVVMCATGDYIFLRARSRDKAQKLIDELMGIGKYTVRPAQVAKGR